MMKGNTPYCRSSRTTGARNEIAEIHICGIRLFVVQNGQIKENNITFATSEWTVYKQATTEILQGVASILIAAACPEVDSGLLREKKKTI